MDGKLAILTCFMFLAGCTASAPHAASIEVLAGTPRSDYIIDPPNLKFEKGADVTLHIKNAGRMGHTFSVPALGLDTGMLMPGQERTLRFTADQAGTFEVHCTVPGHLDQGMHGTMSVA